MNNGKIFGNKMQRTLVVLTFIAFVFPQTLGAEGNEKSKGWENVSEILKNIKAPIFPNKEYNIIAFGAVGDGTTDCLPALKKAIDKCNVEGGGKVIIPKGIFFSKGPVHLKSHVNLCVSEDAVLKFSENPDDYLPVVLTRWEGTECFNYSPFIYAFGVTDVALTGKGTIDGNAKNTFATWKPNQKDDQLLIRKMGNDGVPLNERVFGKDHWLRPVMIQFYNCKNVLLEDVTIIDSPFWVTHPVMCYNVTVRGIKVNSRNLNNDGCDPECSVNVLIEGCNFRTGDDAIAIKAGRDQDAWRVGQSTENIVIRNCQMNSTAGGLCIGSEMSGGVRNVYMEKCDVSVGDNTIDFKSNLDRGGFIENVWVRDINVENAAVSLLDFRTNYHGYRGNHYPPNYDGFTIENIKCKKADNYAIISEGVEDAHMHNIIIKNVTVDKAKYALQVMYSDNFVLDNVKVNGQLLPTHPKMNAGERKAEE